MSFSAGHQTGVGRTGSVSSIALANLHSQRADNRTSSPRPAPPKLPTPPPPRDDKSKFSALGAGGPSDWERFGDGDEIDDEELFAKKDEPNEPRGVELPAHVPSPPSTHGWPSPATHPISSTLDDRKDTYAPTPPLTAASPAQHSSQPPQQTFVMGDPTIAPLKTSPKPMQATQPPPAQQSFVMNNGAWAPPKQSTPTKRETQHQPPPQEGFVMDDGGWAAQSAPSQVREHTPAQQHHQPPPVQTGFVVGDGGWGASQQTPTQTSNSFGAQSSIDHAAELKAKDEALERLRTESEREKADLRFQIEKESVEIRAEMEKERTSLRAEMEKLKADVDSARSHAAAEADTLHKQIETMNVATEQAKTNVDASIKEKDMMIERLKEDVEGKEHNIEERDSIIVELRRELEAEKTKEVPKPTPADLIPDIDPWYIGSLERYIAMLRSEAHEPVIDNKIKTFRAFLRAESTIRGIDYYDAPPPVPVHEPATHQPEHDTLSRGPSNGSSRKRDLNVQVPQDSLAEEDYDYSPGGRPVLKRKTTLHSSESVPIQQHVNPSGQSTTILIPTSSVDDESKRTPVQSPPEDQAQQQYKAYVPSAAVPSNEPASLAHRSTMSFSTIPAVATPSGASKSHDEIFFGAPNSETSKPDSRPTSSDSAAAGIPIPAPLSFSSNRPKSVAAPARATPSNTLADILPAQVKSTAPSQFIEELRSQIASIKPDPNNLEDLTKTWEKAASLSRRKNDDARRKRQEENEEHNDDMFNNNEISYAEMNQLEDEFNQKEGESKAQEDRDEYKSYVEAVFDTIYDGLQADIKTLMDLYIEAENQLHSSVSGIKSLEGGDTPSTKDCLELLKDLHERIEVKHEKVVHAVAERDKRYKKTEIQPLYAAGNITKMKSVERHFENAEKQSVVRAKREKAERVGELVNIAEEIVVRAVGVEQTEIDQILAAIKELDDGEGDADLLSHAHSTLTTLKSSSKALLSLFNMLEIELNDSVLDAEIAEAKAAGENAAKIQGLESEKVAGAKKMTEEFERRVGVLEQDEEEIRELVRRKGGAGEVEVELTEGQERERRLKAALEEAKRRNGDI